MKSKFINLALSIALKDINSLIAFLGRLETKLEDFVRAEEAKAAEIETEITHLVSEKAQVLANVSVAQALKAGVGKLTSAA